MDAAPRRSPKKSLSVEDGRRLLNQYRLLKWKAENSTHQNLVNELQNKIVGLEEAFADITLEADEHRAEADGLANENEALEARLAGITRELDAERARLAEATAAMTAERDAVAAALAAALGALGAERDAVASALHAEREAHAGVAAALTTERAAAAHHIDDAVASALNAEREAHAARVRSLTDAHRSSAATAESERSRLAAAVPALKAELAVQLEEAVAREAAVAASCDVARRLRGERDRALLEHAHALEVSRLSEACLGSLVDELKQYAKVVDAQAAASGALAANAERADGRAARAEDQLAKLRDRVAESEGALAAAKRYAADKERDVLLACDRVAANAADRTDTQREVVELQSLSLIHI